MCWHGKHTQCYGYILLYLKATFVAGRDFWNRDTVKFGFFSVIDKKNFIIDIYEGR